ncbi:MAG: UDP-N-acetylmuramate dehydrogenase [Myxococcaceae bacterium]
MTPTQSLFSGLALEVSENTPLAPWTSVRVGGAAERLVRPRTVDALVELLRRMRESGVPLGVLGGGANTLVSDEGVPGVVVKLPSDMFPDDAVLGGDVVQLTFGAGTPIAKLIVAMKRHQTVGAEFLAGIPGTLGGAVRMNAGTKMGECMSVVEAIEVATADGAGFLPRSTLSVAYRQTQLPAGAVVTRVRFRLPKGDLAHSQKVMDEDLAYRKRTQPLSQPNFGSVFTNPPGDHAGRLIEAAGLKGTMEGKAQVSTLHANWIVNLGGAQARDIGLLMNKMQAGVRDKFGVALHPEVQRLGRH